MKKKLIVLAIASAASLSMAGPIAANTVDLELGLAIDGSGSIDGPGGNDPGNDFATQIDAYTTLLGDPSIVPQDGSVAVGVNLFGANSNTVFDTRIIDSAMDANDLTSTISALSQPGGATDIAGAIDDLTDDITGNDIDSDRQVIDVSTDGRQSAIGAGNVVDPGDIEALNTSVNNAVGDGIDQINCLGIGSDADCSFIPADSFDLDATFDGFQSALETKIAAEVSGTEPAPAPAPAPLALLSLGLAGVGVTGAARRRRQT